MCAQDLRAVLQAPSLPITNHPTFVSVRVMSDDGVRSEAGVAITEIAPIGSFRPGSSLSARKPRPQLCW